MDGMMMTILSRSNNPLKEMIMKRNSFLKLGLIGLLALAISGCNGFEEQKLTDEKVSPDEPFSIIVSPETKTQMSGDNDVVWKDDDAITVFVASKGSSAFSKNYKFERKTTGDVNSFYCNDFVGVLDAQNDWYVFYPYTATIGTPKNNSVSVIVGSAADGSQTQAGNSSRAHLAGDNIPLYGKGTFAAGVVPKITLDQALSVIKVRVTNNTANALTVSSVSFTAPEAIVGSFAIDFSGKDPIFTVTPEQEDQVSTTATLTVNDGSAIAKGKFADFYLAIKPFTVNAGGELVLTVNSESRTLTVPEGGVSFERGLIKTLNFYEMPIPDGDYLILAKNNSNYYALKAEEAQNDHMVSVDYNGDMLHFYGDADMIWSVTRSGASYIIQNDGKYLGWTGGSKDNKAKFQAPGESWTANNYLLDIVSPENAENADIYNIINHNTPERYLSKNTANDYFAFYGNTGQYEEIIFVPATVDDRTPLTLSFVEESINKTTSNYSSFTGQNPTATADEQEVTGLTFTYEIKGDSIGSVDESTGVVTLNGTTGSATVTATFAGNDDYRPTTASYTIAVTAATGPQYKLVSSVDDVTEGDYVITWNNSYYLPSGSTSGTNPAVGTGITVSGTILTNTVTSDMVWTFTGNNTDGFTISDGTNILHSTNAAQGISITTNSTRKWTVSVDGTYGMLLHGDDGGSRYLAVYNNSDWRYYDTSNYTGTLRLYKLSDTREEAPISWSAESGTADWTSAGMATDLPSLSNSEGLQVSFSSTSVSVAEIDENGVVTIVGEGETTISATYDGSVSSAPYKTTVKSYTLTVTDSRTQADEPQFDPGDGTAVNSGAKVSISSSTEGAAIYYTFDNSEFSPSGWVEYSDPIEITEACTIRAIATATNYKNSSIATASYTLVGTTYDFTTVAGLNALVTSDSASYDGYLTDAVVSFVPAANTAIVKDATGSVMIYKSGHGLKQGQTYTGEITVTAIKYNSLYSEITAWSGASFTGSETSVDPESVSLSSLIGHYDDYQNAYVSVAGLTVQSINDKNINVTDGNNTYVVYYNPGGASSVCGAGDIITAIGTITKYKTTEELKVWADSGITVTGHAPKAITFSQPASGGSFTVSVGGSTITSGETVASGTTVTLTATPAANYTFNGWTVTGATVADASATTTTFTMGTSAVSIAASFKEEGSTAPAAGTVLWTDTFGDWGGSSTTFTQLPELSNYTYTGRSGYSDNTDVTLTASSDQVRGASSSATNMTSGHLWFNKSQNATVTTSAIRLYGATSLVLTYDQATNGSSLTAGYSTDGGTTWTGFSASGPAAGNEYTFTVQSGTASVILRFVHSSSNSKNTRFDNPKLAVGN